MSKILNEMLKKLNLEMYKSDNMSLTNYFTAGMQIITLTG
jgi:hypothetical protein